MSIDLEASGLLSAEYEIIWHAREFAQRVIRPNANQWDQHGGMERDFFKQAASAGLCGLLVPKNLGGTAVSYQALSVILAALAEECFASAFALVVHNNLAGTIARYGTTHHHEVLEAMLSGDAIGAFLLTEPDVGSDATAIKTVASKHGSGWQIVGEKAWVTNGAIANVLSIYAQTEPGTGASGIANFLINTDTHSVDRLPRYELLGGHAMNTCALKMDQLRLESSTLMIPPGQAFSAAMKGIDLARMVVSAMCCGMLKRSLEIAFQRASERSVFEQSVFDLQAPQNLLADTATDLQAAWLLSMSAAQKLDANEPATLAAAHAKKFTTRMSLQRIADCMQVMGAVGIQRDYPLARHLACAKIAQYVDGTTEIQNVVIGRLLKQHLQITENRTTGK